MQKSISQCTWRVTTYLCKTSLGTSISKKHLLSQNAESPVRAGGVKCYPEVLSLTFLLPFQWICGSRAISVQQLTSDWSFLPITEYPTLLDQWVVQVDVLLPKEPDCISEGLWSLAWAASGSRLKCSFFVDFVSQWPFSFSGWGNPVSLKNHTLQFIVKHLFPREGCVQCCFRIRGDFDSMK